MGKIRGYIVIKNSGVNISFSNLSYLGYGYGKYNDRWGVTIRSDNNNIHNNVFSNNEMGISLRLNKGTVLHNNTMMHNNYYGIHIVASNSNYISDTRLFKNKINIYVTGNSVNQTIVRVNSYLAPNGIYVKSGSHITVKDSKHFDNGINIYIPKEAYVINNTIYNVSLGIEIGNNSIVMNNTLYNITDNYDGWSTGVVIGSSDSIGRSGNNVSIIKNNISNYGSVGILIYSPSHNITIDDNYIDAVSFTKKDSIEAEDYGEPYSAIAILKQYKTCIPIIKTNATAYNISILNNSFGKNNQVYLYLQGIVNYSASLPPHWHVSFDVPNSVGLFSFFLNPNFSTLYEKHKLGGIIDWFYSGDGLKRDPRYADFAYRISKQKLSFANPTNRTLKVVLNNPKSLLLGVKNDIYLNGSIVATLPVNINLSPPYVFTQYKFYDFNKKSVWYSTIPISVIPSNYPISVEILYWDEVDDYYKWRETSKEVNNVVHNLKVKNPDSEYNLFVNGTFNQKIKSNSTGWVSFNWTSLSNITVFEIK